MFKKPLLIYSKGFLFPNYLYSELYLKR